MASSITTVVGGRVPNDQAGEFRKQAARFGLTTSSAVAALVAGALAVEQSDGQPPLPIPTEDTP